MRKQIAAFLSFILLSVFGLSSAAFAGTEAFNSYKDTNEWGKRVTDINVNQVNREVSNIDSQTVKFEADGGDFNSVNLKFDGDGFTGTASSTDLGFGGSDSAVVYGTTTSEHTRSVSNETVDVNTVETVKFDSSDYTHTVGSGTY